MNSTGAPSAFRRASMASMTGPAAPIAGIHHQLQRGEIVNTDVGEQVVDVGVAQADLSVAAARGLVHRREVARFPPDAERRADRCRRLSGGRPRAPASYRCSPSGYGWRSPQCRRPRRGGRWRSKSLRWPDMPISSTSTPASCNPFASASFSASLVRRTSPPSHDGFRF
ncbi:Uncharacterised protein [Salmonella enterica subsp. enterica]|nr:Uncharacterised protein [Salmonella enterica subsp. enterica] [Salmonella enterica subsp. enterica serovar Menston]